MTADTAQAQPFDAADIAVALPCFNEEVTIAKVVADFRRVLPNAAIHVFDNNSTDGTARAAAEAGAEVHFVPKRGKGHVMRAILDTVKADALVVTDGDDTYYAEDAPKLLEPVLAGRVDMVVGNRLQRADDQSLKLLHQIGNRLIVFGINRMFNTRFRDILSGYRVFSRRFLESIPLLTGGFETECEMTVQSLNNEMIVVEVPINYRARPAGSESKLRSFRDGYRIMLTAAILLRDGHPLRFFGAVGAACMLMALVGAFLRILLYLNIETAPPTLSVGMMLLFGPLGAMAFAVGLIVNAVNTRFREMRQLMERNLRTHG